MTLVRIIIILVIAVILYLVLRMLFNKSQLSVKQFSWIYLAALLGIGLLYLGVTGKLHPLFALLGAVLPFAMRFLSRGIQAASLYQSLRQAKQNLGGAGPGKIPESSEISSRYIHMVLVHKTGRMDGRVLEGSHKDAHLSQMPLEDLLVLLEECQADPDSCNLLIAYLDREHEGWQTHAAGSERTYTDAGKQAGDNRDMTEKQALDILGLPPNTTPEHIVKAHRRLMQKIHPDRGGSTYLAAKINAAKELLMGIRGKTNGNH